MKGGGVLIEVFEKGKINICDNLVVFRAEFYRNTVPPLKTSEQAVSQAFHILNNFDITVGVRFADDQRQYLPDLPCSTQWTAASDLSSAHFYYKTMNDATIRCVDFKNTDFQTARETTHPIDSGSFAFRNATP